MIRRLGVVLRRRTLIADRTALGAIVAAVLAAAVAMGGASCRSPSASSAQPRSAPVGSRPAVSGPLQVPSANSIRSQPLVRVRIAAGRDRVELSSGGPITLGPPADRFQRARPRSFAPPVHISRRDGVFIITDGVANTVRWALPTLQADCGRGQTLVLGDQPYPPTFLLVVVSGPGASERFDVVNHLPIEGYLPGVIDKELYPSWHPIAFAAQAIAARSYALWESALHANRHYDLEATTASQVYGGWTARPKALEAVRQTHGQVLVYGGRVVPAFYSSCSGGFGQDGCAVFPDRVADLPPLRGDRHGWGSQSPDYRWGPISRDATMLSRRLAAWGRANRHAVAALEGLSQIRIGRRSRSGRPAGFVVSDRRGRAFVLWAESFRFACNHPLEGPGGVDRSGILKSSHVDVRVVGPTVWFTNGRGHGHGVGMCQWSAQEMAAHGHSAQAILDFFFRGARLRRLY